MQFRPLKRFGQCFLDDESVAEQIAETIELDGKNVLEIGAGTGILTAFLAARAKKVTALEVDARLIPELRQSVLEFDNVEIVRADALYSEFSGYDAVFGNLPYNISTPLLLKIIESNSPFAVLMVQKEFAQRLVAKPDSREYSRLSVLAQNNASVSIISFVPASCFSPSPRVDSAIVLLEKKRASQVNKLDAALINSLFQHKNQTVRNALMHSAGNFGFGKEEIKKAVAKLSLSERRACSLAVEELTLLSDEWKRAIKATTKKKTVFNPTLIRYLPL